MPIELRALSDKERRELERMTRSKAITVRLAERARIVWAAHQGASAPEIARMLGLSENTVRTWITRFNAEGLAGLEDRGRTGRPECYTAEQIAEIVQLATTPPAALGLSYHRWTLDRLEAYLNDERGIEIKRSRLGEVLLARGIRLASGATGPLPEDG